MNQDMSAAVSSLMRNTWSFFTETLFPGTVMSIAEILIGSVIVLVSLRLIAYIFNFNLRDLRRGEQRGGNNKNIKVEDNRKDDTN